MHESTAASPSHPTAVVVAHWATALALLLAFGLVLGRELVEDKAMRALILDAHRAVGLCIAVLVLLRLALRSRLPLAPAPAGTPRWQQRAAKAMQASMYLCLAALPVLGYALTNAHGQAVTFPGLGALPVWLPRDLDLADTLEGVHASVAWVLLALVAGHAGAAVWHHRVKRDGVLRAMWPGLRRST